MQWWIFTSQPLRPSGSPSGGNKGLTTGESKHYASRSVLLGASDLSLCEGGGTFLQLVWSASSTVEPTFAEMPTKLHFHKWSLLFAFLFVKEARLWLAHHQFLANNYHLAWLYTGLAWHAAFLVCWTCMAHELCLQFYTLHRHDPAAPLQAGTFELFMCWQYPVRHLPDCLINF